MRKTFSCLHVNLRWNVVQFGLSKQKKDLKKGMLFSSKEKLKMTVTIWSLHKNKEFKVVTSTKSLWVVRCKFYNLLGCMWFLRGRQVGEKF